MKSRANQHKRPGRCFLPQACSDPARYVRLGSLDGSLLTLLDGGKLPLTTALRLVDFRYTASPLAPRT